MVDDAHGTGVLGKEGTGTVEHFDLGEAVDIQVGTLSKALGGEGGFIAGKRDDSRMVAYSGKIFWTGLCQAKIE